MSKRTDPHYLTTVQYKDAEKLNARIQLHQRFSVNKHDWQRWVFERLVAPGAGRLLEIGCGPGHLWSRNSDRIPNGWRLVLSDISAGMIREARGNLQDCHSSRCFTRLDIQHLPFDTASFDVVIANHMLYHVADKKRALSEVYRVLQPGGRFYAATNGRRHMAKLTELVARFDPESERDQTLEAMIEAFGLETGQDQLLSIFPQVALHLYEDALVVTEAVPLAAYILSMDRSRAIQERSAEFVRFLEDELKLQGAIYIEKATGLFEACKTG